MVVKENLPFTHIESESFLNVVEHLNPDALELLVKGDAICGHVTKCYFQIRSQVQIDDIGTWYGRSKGESEAAGVPRCRGVPLATPGSACSEYTQSWY